MAVEWMIQITPGPLLLLAIGGCHCSTISALSEVEPLDICIDVPFQIKKVNKTLIMLIYSEVVSYMLVAIWHVSMILISVKWLFRLSLISVENLPK